MRHFSVRPSLTLRGRKNKGLRGLSGKPLHPPLTDIPIGAYLLAAVFDVISTVGGDDHGWAQDFWHAGTYAFVGGAAVSVLAAVTGAVDWSRSSQPGTQARRTINTHALIMITVTALTLVDVAVRVSQYDDRSAPVVLTVLSVVIALLVSVGATYGGSLVFDYGFNVETAGDHPVWHTSEVDVLPGEHSSS
jgi:uncharacterized membrane protein